MQRALFALVLLALSPLHSSGQYIRVTAHQVYTQTSSRGRSAWESPQIPTTGKIEAELTVYLPNLTSAKTSGYRGLTYGLGGWRGNGISLRIGKQRYRPLTVRAKGLLMEGNVGFGEKATAPDGVFTLGSIETPLQEIGAPLVPLLTLSGMVLQTVAPYWGTAGPLVPHLELQAEPGDHNGWLDVGTFGVERHGDLSTAHYQLDKIIIDAGTPDIPLHDLIADRTPAQFGGPPEPPSEPDLQTSPVRSGAGKVATACRQVMTELLKSQYRNQLFNLYAEGDELAFGAEALRLDRLVIGSTAACTVAQLWAAMENSEGNSSASGSTPKYESSPKHGNEQVGNVGKEPADGQKTLNNSVPVKPTTTRRIGVDPDHDEIVVFDETNRELNLFHGHVRGWNELTPDMQNALRRAGLVDKRGVILPE